MPKESRQKISDANVEAADAKGITSRGPNANINDTIAPKSSDAKGSASKIFDANAEAADTEGNASKGSNANANNVRSEWFTVPDEAGLAAVNKKRREGQPRNVALKSQRMFKPDGAVAMEVVNSWKAVIEVSHRHLSFHSRPHHGHLSSC